MRFDTISFLEKVHAEHASTEAWLNGLVTSASALDNGFGVMALLADASRSDAVDILALACLEHVRPWVNEVIQRVRSAPPAWVEATYTFGADLLSQRQRGLPLQLPPGGEVLGGQDYDALGVIGTDPSRMGCVVFAPVARGYRPAPRRLYVLRKVAAHLAPAGRLRRANYASGMPDPDAVLSPDGRMLHGNPVATSAALREVFRANVRAIDRARGKLRRTDPDDALELWTGLVAGEWSLVEYEERDGKRYLLARRNPPKVARHLALSGIEASVASYAALGHSTKFISYELGLSVSTVSTHLRNVLAKLRIPSRSELIRLFAHSRAGVSNAFAASTRSG